LSEEHQKKIEEAKIARQNQVSRDALRVSPATNRSAIRENVEKVSQHNENFPLSEYVPVKKIIYPEKVFAISAGVDATPFKKSFKPNEDYYKASFGIQNALSLGLFDANTVNWINNNSMAINKISSYGSLNDLQNDWKNLEKDLGRDKVHSASGVLNMILAFLRALKSYAPLEQLCGKIDMREFETDKSALKIPKGGLSLILGSNIQKTEERFVHAVIKEKTENEDKPPVKIEEEPTFVPIREDREPTFVPIKTTVSETNVPLEQTQEETNVPLEQTQEETNVPLEQTQEETNVPLEQTQEETNVPVEQSQEETNVPVEQSQEETNVPDDSQNFTDSTIVSENSSSTISPLSTSNTEETTPESFSLNDNYTPITVAPEKNYTPIASEEDSTVLPELEESQESRVVISESLDSTKIVLMDIVSNGATNIRGEFGEIGKEIVRLKESEVPVSQIPTIISNSDQYKSYSEKINEIITNISNEFEQLSNGIKESSPENTQICSEIEHLQESIQNKFKELKNFTVISNGNFEDKINEINEEIEMLEALKLGQ
jgi:hypothetical protein